jgi:hypothetical protein
MKAQADPYLAVGSPWQGQWEVLIVNPSGELIGRTLVDAPQQVSRAATEWLCERIGGSPRRLTVVPGGSAAATPQEPVIATSPTRRALADGRPAGRMVAGSGLSRSLRWRRR